MTVVRYQTDIGADGQDHGSVEPSVTIGHGPNATDVVQDDGIGGSKSSGVVRISSADLQRPATAGILATAECNGFPVSGTSLHTRRDVTVLDRSSGMRTSLANAVRLGLIGQTSSGEYYDLANPANLAAETQAAEQAKAQQEVNSTQPQLFTGGLEEELARAIQPMDQGTFDHALTEMATTGKVHPQTVQTMAHQMNCSNAEVLALAGKVTAAFQGQAATAAAQGGAPDFQQLVEWASAHRPEALAEAGRTLAFARNPIGFQELAQDFLRSYIPSAEEVRAAGYKVERRNGVDIVTLPNGVEMSIASVARAGWFKRG